MRLIDADALIYGLRDYTFTLNPDDPDATKEYSLVSKMIEILENAPTIEPERKTGRWIDHVEDGYVECPFYHSATNCEDNISDLHFCFSCGARMEGEG